MNQRGLAMIVTMVFLPVVAAGLIWLAARVYEVLSGKRGLSIQMIRRLHRGLGIPLEVLIAEPKRA